MNSHVKLREAIEAYFGTVHPTLSCRVTEETPEGRAEHIVFGVYTALDTFRSEDEARYALYRMLLMSVIDAFPTGGLLVWRRLPTFEVVRNEMEHFEGAAPYYRATIRLGVAGKAPRKTRLLATEGAPFEKYPFFEEPAK